MTQLFFELLLNNLNTKSYHLLKNAFSLIIFTMLRMGKTNELLSHLKQIPPSEIIFNFFYGNWDILSRYFNETNLKKFKDYHKVKLIVHE